MKRKWINKPGVATVIVMWLSLWLIPVTLTLFLTKTHHSTHGTGLSTPGLIVLGVYLLPVALLMFVEGVKLLWHYRPRKVWVDDER